MGIPAGTVIDGYEILGLLGRGGQSQVYEARDTRLRRHVALKILSDALLSDEISQRRFLLEAQTLSALSHPGIAGVYHIGAFEGAPYIVMERVRGTTLTRHLEQHPLDDAGRLRLMTRMVEAIQYAHDQGFIHRDLKPGNILVTEDGQPKLVDFGLARIVRQAERERLDSPGELTTAGTILGTVSYLSPEQAVSRPSTERSDLFSLGVIFYEMLTGRRPFDRDSAVATLFATLHDLHPPLPGETALGRAMGPVIDRLLQKDPPARPASAAVLLEELRAVAGDLSGDSAGGATDRPADPPPTRGRRHRRPWAAALALAGLLAVVGLAIWRPWAPPVAERSDPDRRTGILVLPIQSGPDEQGRYLGGLITSEVISTLNRTPRLRVLSIPPGTAGGQADWVERVLARNEVSFILKGDLALHGDNLRLAVQILDPRDAAVVWARQFQEDISRIFTIPSVIAAQLAYGAGVIVKADRLEFPGREAFDAYTRGDMLLSTYDPATLSQAVAHFQACARLAPGFWPVYERLGAAFLQFRNTGLDYRPELLDQAHDYVRAGLELQPDAPGLRVLEAWYHLYSYDFRPARERVRAIDVDRVESAGVWKCRVWVALYFGEPEVAVAELERCVRQDPFDQTAHVNRVVIHAMLGDRAGVDAAYAEGRDIFGSPLAAAILTGWWRMAHGDFEGAATAFGSVAPDPAYRLLDLAQAEAHFAGGRYADARPLLERWLAQNPFAVEGWWLLCLAHEAVGDGAGQQAAARRALTRIGELIDRHPNAFLEAAEFYFGTLADPAAPAAPGLDERELAGHDTLTRYLTGAALARRGQTGELARLPTPYSPIYWMNRFADREIDLIRARRMPGAGLPGGRDEGRPR